MDRIFFCVSLPGCGVSSLLIGVEWNNTEQRAGGDSIHFIPGVRLASHSRQLVYLSINGCRESGFMNHSRYNLQFETASSRLSPVSLKANQRAMSNLKASVQPFFYSPSQFLHFGMSPFKRSCIVSVIVQNGGFLSALKQRRLAQPTGAQCSANTIWW